MANIGLIFLVFAFVLFCIAARIRLVGNPPGWDLLALGLAFWVAAELIGGLGRVFH